MHSDASFILDGLPVELKESGLAEQAGMIVLRERHKGSAWRAADAIIDPLFELLDPQACGHIPAEKFQQYFSHRLHPELERHQSSPAAARHRSIFNSIIFDMTLEVRLMAAPKELEYGISTVVVQGARQTYRARMAARARELAASFPALEC